MVKLLTMFLSASLLLFTQFSLAAVRVKAGDTLTFKCSYFGRAPDQVSTVTVAEVASGQAILTSHDNCLGYGRIYVNWMGSESEAILKYCETYPALHGRLVVTTFAGKQIQACHTPSGTEFAVESPINFSKYVFNWGMKRTPRYSAELISWQIK